MSARIAQVVIAARDAKLVAEFWAEVLGWVVLDVEDDVVWCIGPSDGALPGIDVVPVAEPKTVQNRLHLDLRADGTTTAGELERLLALGAVRIDVGQGADVSWTVLADPEGNEFCLLSRTIQELSAG